MPDLLEPGAGFVYMKVGTHASEPLADIYARKRREIDEAGYGLWGYGGNTCHPLSMLQPFAREYVARDGVIYLCMQEMNSRHFAEQVRASQMTADGLHWEKIPDPVNVLGSRFALRIVELRQESFELPLTGTRVAFGNSRGRRGDMYISGHVDKGCLELVEEAPSAPVADPKIVQIGLVARLAEPYAVIVK